MDYLGIGDAFDESRATLEKLLGLKISSSRFEVVTRDTSTSYNEFYEHQSPLPPDAHASHRAHQLGCCTLRTNLIFTLSHSFTNF